MPLIWKGDQVEAELIQRLTRGVKMLGLAVEAEAKEELTPGHGVLTGTLRRSIQTGEPELSGTKIVVAVGSPLGYSIWVHQGHHSFGGYHFMTIGVDRVRPRALSILQRAVG